jgi:hypothetical protein
MGPRSFIRRVLAHMSHPDVSIDRSWRPGDMAECIGSGTWRDLITGVPTLGPEFHEIRMVTDARMTSHVDGSQHIWLLFARWPKIGFDAASFRKIVPQADRSGAADAEFLPSLQPARKTEPAL